MKLKWRVWIHFFLSTCAFWKTRNWTIIVFSSRRTKSCIKNWTYFYQKCDFQMKNLIFLLLLFKKFVFQLYIFYVVDIWNKTFSSIVTNIFEIERIRKNYEFNFLTINMIRLLYRVIFNIFCTFQMRKNSMRFEKTFNAFTNQSMTTYLATLFKKFCSKKSNDVKCESTNIYISTITSFLDRKINMLHSKRLYEILKTTSIL